MDENQEQLTAGEVASDDLESVILAQVPDAYENLPSILALGGEFFAGGVLIAFILWTIGYAIHAAFGLLDQVSR